MWSGAGVCARLACVAGTAGPFSLAVVRWAEGSSAERCILIIAQCFASPSTHPHFRRSSSKIEWHALGTHTLNTLGTLSWTASE